MQRAGERIAQPLPAADAAFDFARAYYVKLGMGGAWAADSIANGLLRLGWAAFRWPRFTPATQWQIGIGDPCTQFRKVRGRAKRKFLVATVRR